MNYKLYEHYKGGIYRVIGVAKHSETLEELVVYKNNAGDIWVRPADMFFANVEVDGESVPRFERIGEINE